MNFQEKKLKAPEEANTVKLQIAEYDEWRHRHRLILQKQKTEKDLNGLIKYNL